MAFDPQAYIKAKTAGAQQPFDPAAFIASRKPPAEGISKLESFGRGALQTGTLGFGDEITGALESLAGSAGLVPDKTYTQARDESRANNTAAEEANPITSTLGGIAGGVGQALLTPGALGLTMAGKTGLFAGSKLGQAAVLGAKLGGLSGAGNSEASWRDPAGIAHDVGVGAATGGVMGGAFQGATSAVVGGARMAGRGVGHFFDPVINRLKAMGANERMIAKAGGLEKVAPAVEFAEKAGIMAKDAQGIAATPELMQDRVVSKMDDIAAAMHDRVEGQPIPKVPVQAVWDTIKHDMTQEVMESHPSGVEAGLKYIDQLGERFVKTDGDVPALWDLKKKSGNWVNWDKRALTQDPPIVQELTKKFNQELGDIVVAHVDDVARANPDLKGLGELNGEYSKMATLNNFLGKTVEKQALSGGPTLTRMKDYVQAAAAGGGLGAMTGIPGLGGMAGTAALAAGAISRSTGGLLARANAGETAQLAAQKVSEMLQLNQAGTRTLADGTQQAIAAGLIPRTLSGARAWLQQHWQMVPPQMQQAAKAIMTLPDAAAELQVRTIMPMFTAYLQPSSYPSEFNGKVVAPQDRVTARQVILSQGLPPSVSAYHQSLLNKTGTLQPYHYAPTPEDYGDQRLNHNERLTSLGY